jgi:predicted DNA repair protein MutK
MDDVGAWMALNGKTGLGRGVGTGLVKGMPHLLTVLSIVGTAAMLWVGGSILVHGLHDPDFLGWVQPYSFIKETAHAIAGDSGFGKWAVTAFADGVLGLAVGLVLIPIVTKVVMPLFGGSKAAH